MRNFRSFEKSNYDERINFAQFKRHTSRVLEIPSYLETEKRAHDTNEFKINPKKIQLIDIPGRIQLTDTLGRHPSSIVELLNTSPPSPVPKKERDKGIKG